MLEASRREELPQIIASILNSRDWYVNDKNGNSNWTKSIESLAEKISQIAPISATKLQEIIEDSFDEEALSENKDGNKFLDQLLELDPNLIIWTEGDYSWQEKKVQKTQITGRGTQIHYHPHKLEILESLVDSIDQEGPCILVIIDDKETNLATIKDLNKKFKNIKIFGYQFDLKSKGKNPDACLKFLRKKAKKGKLRIISDMDRVLVDTRKTFSQKTALRITQEITSPSR